MIKDIKKEKFIIAQSFQTFKMDFLMKEEHSKILGDFTINRPLYCSYSLNMEKLVKTILTDSKIYIHSVKSRTKEIKNLYDTLLKKDTKYSSYTDINDLSGVRIICLLSSDVDKVAELIKKYFKVIPELSIDKKTVMDPDRFGYLSQHYVVKLTGERAKLPEFEKYTDLKCEIQIRTLLQHAWAEIEHDLGYKSKIEIPKNVKRRFYRLAGLLELGDNEFEGLKQDIDEYKNLVNNKIKDSSQELLIDKVSLKTYVSQSKIISEIDPKLAKLIGAKLRQEDNFEFELKILNFFRIKTIKDLDNMIRKYQEDILNFANKWMEIIVDEKIETDEVGIGITIFYLGYHLLMLSNDVKKIENYIQVLGFDNPGKTFINLKQMMEV